MQTLIIIFICISTLTYSQSYENVFSQINVTNKIVKTKIINGDTLFILEKKAGSKYVDSLKLNTLDKRLNYTFSLPDSLSDGKYCVFYNEKKQNIAFVICYKNGKRNGAFKILHYNGQLKEAGFYADNCLDKVFLMYDRLGMLFRITNYSNCELNGPLIEVANGQFFRIINYVDGKLDGYRIEYLFDKNNFPTIRNESDYNNGQQIKKK